MRQSQRPFDGHWTCHHWPADRGASQLSYLWTRLVNIANWPYVYGHSTNPVKDIAQLLQKLKGLKQLPKTAGCLLRTPMYTNLDTNQAMEVIYNLLDSLSLPEGFPWKAVKSAMERIMCNDIFEWEESYFLKLLGTAMGTLPVCGLLYILQSMK